MKTKETSMFGYLGPESAQTMEDKIPSSNLEPENFQNSQELNTQRART